jgi:hypothetical protein
MYVEVLIDINSENSIIKAWEFPTLLLQLYMKRQCYNISKITRINSILLEKRIDILNQLDGYCTILIHLLSLFYKLEVMILNR